MTDEIIIVKHLVWRAEPLNGLDGRRCCVSSTSVWEELLLYQYVLMRLRGVPWYTGSTVASHRMVVERGARC